DSSPLLCRYGKHAYGCLSSPLFLVKQQSARYRSEPAFPQYSVCAAVVEHRSYEHFYNTTRTYSAVIHGMLCEGKFDNQKPIQQPFFDVEQALILFFLKRLAASAYPGSDPQPTFLIEHSPLQAAGDGAVQLPLNHHISSSSCRKWLH